MKNEKKYENIVSVDNATKEIMTYITDELNETIFEGTSESYKKLDGKFQELNQKLAEIHKLANDLNSIVDKGYREFEVKILAEISGTSKSHEESGVLINKGINGLNDKFLSISKTVNEVSNNLTETKNEMSSIQSNINNMFAGYTKKITDDYGTKEEKYTELVNKLNSDIGGHIEKVFDEVSRFGNNANEILCTNSSELLKMNNINEENNKKLLIEIDKIRRIAEYNSLPFYKKWFRRIEND
ncbi:protein of unknown function [Petrocella atlantisensis]|uniref:Uncharacterized protein n=1 Tax=Petrocella atlantisensis TaxID=2173034 RepID=A0A3P7NWF4_9FIRM|nr:hypothetical protein [Petrocella atlantisensis]VDN47245.1 protein of unknown function [Petrocella atlantisensis]